MSQLYRISNIICLAVSHYLTLGICDLAPHNLEILVMKQRAEVI